MFTCIGSGGGGGGVHPSTAYSLPTQNSFFHLPHGVLTLLFIIIFIFTQGPNEHLSQSDGTITAYSGSRVEK